MSSIRKLNLLQKHLVDIGFKQIAAKSCGVKDISIGLRVRRNRPPILVVGNLTIVWLHKKSVYRIFSPQQPRRSGRWVHRSDGQYHISESTEAGAATAIEWGTCPTPPRAA